MFRHLIVLASVISTLLSAQAYYDTDEWAALFHIKNNQQSDISDPNFYLSEDKTLVSEYNAALLALNQEDVNVTLCRYPARYRYLDKKLNLNLSFKHCENFMQFLDESRGTSASISFASAYLESPMSYFGHTFITIHKRNNRFFLKPYHSRQKFRKKSIFSNLQQKELAEVFLENF
jgi:hypothetical protein